MSLKPTLSNLLAFGTDDKNVYLMYNLLKLVMLDFCQLQNKVTRKAVVRVATQIL